MDPQLSKLQQEQKETSPALATGAQSAAGREFATVDDLLRFDAAQTVVPSEVGERLRESVSQEPRPKTSWWKRWFGRREA